MQKKENRQQNPFLLFIHFIKIRMGESIYIFIPYAEETKLITKIAV